MYLTFFLPPYMGMYNLPSIAAPPIRCFFSRPLPKAGRELQTELNTMMNEGGMRTLSEKPAGGKCYSSESTIILTVGNIDSH